MSLLSLVGGKNLPFPIRRVYCVGRNYAEHRKEMGGGERDPPFFFQKPCDALIQTGSSYRYPKNTSQLSYEAELVVVMDGPREIFGYALGVDFTKRDLQTDAKKNSRPWESSKSFDNSGVIGDIAPANEVGENIISSKLELLLNGDVRQSATIDQMIWSIPELMTNLELQDFSLKRGDVIFTGTPAGVGTVSIGDELRIRLTSPETGRDIVPQLVFKIAH